MRFTGTLVMALLAGSASIGCLDPTQITLEISTDAQCESGVLEQLYTGIAVGPDAVSTNQVAEVSTGACPPALETRIGSLVFTPHDDDRARLSFEVITSLQQTLDNCDPQADELAAHCIVARRTLNYLPQRGLKVPVVMRTACAGVQCPEGKTCVDGGCVEQEIVPEECTDEEGCGEEKLPEPDLGWALALPISGGGSSLGAVVDSEQNVTIAGSFSGTIQIGDDTFMADQEDLFVASFGPDGSHRWSYQLGTSVGVETDDWNHLAVDGDGAVYVTASFEGTLIVDGQTHVTPPGDQGTCIVKFDKPGDVDWGVVHSGVEGSGGTLELHDMVARDGALHVAGGMTGMVQLYGQQSWLAAEVGIDVVAARFDASTGMAQWSQVFVGMGDDEADRLAVEPSGDLHLVGRFTGALPVGLAELSPSDDIDMFHFVLEPTQTNTSIVVRAASFAGDGSEAAAGVGLTPQGQLCMGGTYGATLWFADQNLGDGSGPAMFAGCLDGSSSAVWADGFASDGQSILHSVELDAEGFMYLGGELSGTVPLGAQEILADTHSQFVAVLRAADGELEWVTVIPPSEETFQLTRAVGRGGESVFVTGTFEGEVEIAGQTLVSSGPQDIFVAQVKRPSP